MPKRRSLWSILGDISLATDLGVWVWRALWLVTVGILGLTVMQAAWMAALVVLAVLLVVSVVAWKYEGEDLLPHFSRFPDIHVNEGDIWVQDYWPAGSSVRYLVLKNVRIANNEDHSVNLQPTFHFTRPDYELPEGEIWPAVGPTPFDRKTEREPLGEIINIGRESAVSGYLSFPIGGIQQGFLYMGEGHTDQTLFNGWLRLEDVHTGIVHEYATHDFLMNTE